MLTGIRGQTPEPLANRLGLPYRPWLSPSGCTHPFGDETGLDSPKFRAEEAGISTASPQRRSAMVRLQPFNRGNYQLSNRFI
jgi:hypothetical protein